MPNYRRANLAGGTYFFTVNTLLRLPVLTEAPVREALREAIRQTRLTAPFDIDAWVLLPDHWHCIWTLPQGDADFSMRWSTIKRYVKHGLVARAIDWPYSTFQRFVRDGVYSSDWGLAQAVSMTAGE